MVDLLIVGGVGLFIGCSIGVFAMARFKVPEPVPAPDARHVEPFRQERDAPLRQQRRNEAWQRISRRVHPWHIY